MMERRRLHWKESSTIAAIRELGLERLEAVCSLWIVAALGNILQFIHDFIIWLTIVMSTAENIGLELRQ